MIKTALARTEDDDASDIAVDRWAPLTLQQLLDAFTERPRELEGSRTPEPALTQLEERRLLKAGG